MTETLWHSSGAPPRSRCRLSVIVPAFNEAERLPALLDALATNPTTSAAGTELIVVDDGSTDETGAVARRLLAPTNRAMLVTLPANAGKGAALRAGVAQARGERMVFMDADLATDLRCLPGLLASLDQHPIAIGSRAVPGSVVHNGSPARRLMGTTYNRLLRLVTSIDVSDSQCGFKAFRGSTARLLFALSVLDGFGQDAELLDLAGQLNLAVVELPVEWTNQPGSTVLPLRHSAQTALELVRHKRRRGKKLTVAALAVRADLQHRATDPLVGELVLFPLLVQPPQRLLDQASEASTLSWAQLRSLFG